MTVNTSQNQVRRLLSLVPYLREHDGVSLTVVAAAFNVSEETLRVTSTCSGCAACPA